MIRADNNKKRANQNDSPDANSTKRRKQEHCQETKGCQLEEATATTRPDKVLYLTFDDTCSLGLPKLTNRDLKNLGNSRFDAIPFDDMPGLIEYQTVCRQFIGSSVCKLSSAQKFN